MSMSLPCVCSDAAWLALSYTTAGERYNVSAFTGIVFFFFNVFSCSGLSALCWRKSVSNCSRQLLAVGHQSCLLPFDVHRIQRTCFLHHHYWKWAFLNGTQCWSMCGSGKDCVHAVSLCYTRRVAKEVLLNSLNSKFNHESERIYGDSSSMSSHHNTSDFRHVTQMSALGNAKKKKEQRKKIHFVRRTKTSREAKALLY